jgi:hypothetical protein
MQKHNSIHVICWFFNATLLDTYVTCKSIFQFRGRYSVELHLSFLRLQGQANDFKIQYSSVVRLFLLPKVCFNYLSTYISICMFQMMISLEPWYDFNQSCSWKVAFSYCFRIRETEIVGQRVQEDMSLCTFCIEIHSKTVQKMDLFYVFVPIFPTKHIFVPIVYLFYLETITKRYQMIANGI